MQDDLEARIAALEARAAISDLRARYCLYVDASRWDAVAELFAEDAEFAGLGVARGREQIRKVFEGAPDAMDAWWHFIHNEVTEVDGDVASGSSYFDAPCVIEGVPHLCAGRYDERFAKRDGRWLFAERRLTYFYLTPLSEGWRRGAVPQALRPLAQGD